MKRVVLKVNDFAFGGDGTAVMPDGKICFLPGTVPGDTVSVEIVQDKKNFARGRVTAFVEKSGKRIDSFCPHRNDPVPCPGCVYGEVSYETELETKQKQLEFFLRQFAVPVIHPPFPSPKRTGYRNKISLSCENGVAGYRAADNSTLVPVTTCPLARKAITDRMITFLPSPAADRVTYRWTLTDGVFVLEHPELFPPDVEHLTEQIGQHGRFHVPVNSFFQVNMPVAEELANRVLSFLKAFEPEHLVELYCGSGIFSILAAEQLTALRTTGVELDPGAIKAAQKNAADHKTSARCKFTCGDAAQFKTDRNMNPEKIVLLTDPPRTGMSKEVIERILKLGPKRILYISCAPDKLRRDLQLLSARYKVAESALLDMFPCTAHFESLTLLEKL